MITANELKFFESTNLLGGAITANEITDNELHNVFDLVDSDEALLGSVEYRCIYIKNGNGSITLENALIYIASQTTSVTSKIELALGAGAIGSSEQVIPNETTPPAGVTFTELVGEANSLAIGSIPPNSHKAFWLKRTVDAGSQAITGDQFSLTVSGDTGA